VDDQQSPPKAGVKDAEREWQNATGWTFQERAHARAGTRYVIERQFERIARALAARAEDRVLELGCGTGHLIAWLSEHAPARYLGIDLSLTTVRAARAANPGTRFTTADAERLPFRDRSFDHISCNGSGHHFLNLEAALREAHRVLRPGGRLVMYEPIATPLANAVRGGLLRESRYESPADLAHKHEFSRKTLEATLAAAGFEDVSSRFHDFLAYPLTGMYIELPWSRSRGLMRVLAAIEHGLERIAPLRPLFDLLSWRLLVIAARPRGGAA
jgi:SAM-dependent methyltransferase